MTTERKKCIDCKWFQMDSRSGFWHWLFFFLSPPFTSFEDDLQRCYCEHPNIKKFNDEHDKTDSMMETIVLGKSNEKILHPPMRCWKCRNGLFLNVSMPSCGMSGDWFEPKGSKDDA